MSDIQKVRDYLSKHGSITVREAKDKLNVNDLRSRVSQMPDVVRLRMKEVVRKDGQITRVAEYGLI